jgi:hypothetical protein
VTRFVKLVRDANRFQIMNASEPTIACNYFFLDNSHVYDE